MESHFTYTTKLHKYFNPVFAYKATFFAKSGLSIREQPSKNGKFIITAPYQAKLRVLETDVEYDYTDGKTGYWYKVEYRGKIGFAFGNYSRR